MAGRDYRSGTPDSVERRLRSLEGWRDDVARELREWAAEWEWMKPFVEQLRADLTYRQRRHAESAGDWSRLAKIAAASVGIVLAVTAVASFVLQVVHAWRGH